MQGNYSLKLPVFKVEKHGYLIHCWSGKDKGCLYPICIRHTILFYWSHLRLGLLSWELQDGGHRDQCMILSFSKGLRGHLRNINYCHVTPSPVNNLRWNLKNLSRGLNPPKSAKTRFKFSAGLNLETFNTILSGTNNI